MATITKHFTVCDVGGEKCDNSALHKVRVTIDGKTKASVVCEKHVTPWTKLHQGRTVAGKARVYSTPDEAKRG